MWIPACERTLLASGSASWRSGCWGSLATGVSEEKLIGIGARVLRFWYCEYLYIAPKDLIACSG